MARNLAKGRLSTVLGDQELIQALAAVSEAADRRIIRSALSKSLTPVVRALRAAAPVGEGKELKKSAGKRVKKKKRTGITEAKAGYNVGGGKTKAPHAHLVTLGTEDRYTKKGAFRGHVKPDELAAEAWKQSASQQQQIMRDEVRKGILKEVAKQKKGPKA
jgi:HK97 gp10 family phage protein